MNIFKLQGLVINDSLIQDGRPFPVTTFVPTLHAAQRLGQSWCWANGGSGYTSRSKSQYNKNE
jgi:hypothetical protein